MQRFLLTRTTLVALASTLMLAAAPAASSVAAAPCPLPANKAAQQGVKEKASKKNKRHENGQKKKKKRRPHGKKRAAEQKPIALKPEANSEIVNFGGTRGIKRIDVVLLASHPLPKTFSPKELELDSPKRFSRSSQTLNSATLPLPRFSRPQLIEHRKKIRLAVCVSASGVSAGSYAGTVYVSGPPGITGASLAITANVKTRQGIFFLMLGLALFVAFLLLLFKAAKEVRENDEAAKKADSTKVVTGWGNALKSRFTDLTFIVSTMIALVAALVAMCAVYNNTPAWGADSWTNAFALFGTAFGAAGVGSLITAFVPKSG